MFSLFAACFFMVNELRNISVFTVSSLAMDDGCSRFILHVVGCVYRQAVSMSSKAQINSITIHLSRLKHL
jgi:hypothetical protein